MTASCSPEEHARLLRAIKHYCQRTGTQLLQLAQAAGVEPQRLYNREQVKFRFAPREAAALRETMDKHRDGVARYRRTHPAERLKGPMMSESERQRRVDERLAERRAHVARCLAAEKPGLAGQRRSQIPIEETFL